MEEPSAPRADRDCTPDRGELPLGAEQAVVMLLFPHRLARSSPFDDHWTSTWPQGQGRRKGGWTSESLACWAKPKQEVDIAGQVVERFSS